MKKKAFVVLLIACLFTISTSHVWAWGVWAHNHINKGAVLALPKEMGMFFYNHSDFITEESTVPDIRKYTMGDKTEGRKHYINLEQFNYTSRTMMPKNLHDTEIKYGKDSLDKWGILPWVIQDMMAKLTDAFRNKKKTEILLIAADLGHYIADAHMPLHTTVNHDGKLTGQPGMHAFWESQLPELFGKNYNLYTGDAIYLKDVEQTTWNMIDSSFYLVRPLLYTESKMRKDNPEDKQYVMDANGKPAKNKYGQPIHAFEYAHVYHELLNGMVEKQMRTAIKLTADYWYTAWVNAGKPDLTDMDPDYTTERNKPFYKQDMKTWQKGKVKGCKSDKEF
ncbi:MAG: Nuclease [Flavipsychrobacter sp.]|nr:Nuclease [Flavipsychrobacter sp.]